MSGTEVHEAWAADSLREWEEINTPDPAAEQMKKAAAEIMKALRLMDDANIRLLSAQSEVSGTPMEDVIGSFYHSQLDVVIQLNDLRLKYERGER